MTAATGSAAPPAPPAEPYARAARACAALEAAMAGRPWSTRHSPFRLFSSESLPPITLPKYACHLAARMDHGEHGIALGIVLVVRAWRTTMVAPTPDTAHRLLLTATVVAMKTHFDDYYVNKYMARIGGLQTPGELKELEGDFFFNLVKCGANVKERELAHVLEKLASIGHDLQRGRMSPEAARRCVEYFIAQDVLPSTTFDAFAAIPPQHRSGVASPPSAMLSVPPQRHPQQQQHQAPRPAAASALGASNLPAFVPVAGAPSSNPAGPAMLSQKTAGTDQPLPMLVTLHTDGNDASRCAGDMSTTQSVCTSQASPHSAHQRPLWNAAPRSGASQTTYLTDPAHYSLDRASAAASDGLATHQRQTLPAVDVIANDGTSVCGLSQCAGASATTTTHGHGGLALQASTSHAAGSGASFARASRTTECGTTPQTSTESVPNIYGR